MIQATHRDVEIEMELHQVENGRWKCDFAVIRHPGRNQIIHYGEEEFSTIDLAEQHALKEARAAIDRAL